MSNVIKQLPNDVYYYHIFILFNDPKILRNIYRVCKYWRYLIRKYLRDDLTRINRHHLGCLEDIFRTPIIWDHIRGTMERAIWSWDGFRDKCNHKTLKGNHWLIDSVYVLIKHSILKIGIKAFLVERWPTTYSLSDWCCWEISLWKDIYTINKFLLKI